MANNVKEQIRNELRLRCGSQSLTNMIITAEQLADQLGIKRNTASHYLNELVNEGIAVKVNTRPVRFFDNGRLSETLHQKCQSEYDSVAALFSSKAESHDVFDQVIGSRESLFMQIKQMKAAARYPGVGLPILITGPTGVGKSYLAQVYYQYNVQQHYLGEHSRFVHLNCAEYADNPELLASILFGYTRGAFTGADHDKQGLFDEANHGMLFLDEVHRLGAKGQEKLFEYLDNGVITPLGATKMGHAVQVRLIFATTEDVASTFLQTFIRRIPVEIEIPSLDDRPQIEREELAKLFFLQQARHIDHPLKLNNQVLAAITSNSYESNVGQLKNDVTITVANALEHTSPDSGDTTVEVYMSDLPRNVWRNVGTGQQIRLIGDNTPTVIRQSMSVFQLVAGDDTQGNQIRDTFQQILAIYGRIGMGDEFLNSAMASVNTLCDELIYNKLVHRGSIPIKLFQQLFQMKINTYESDDDVEFSGNTVIVLAYFFYYRQFNYWNVSAKNHEALTSLSNTVAIQYLKETKFADDLLGMIQDSLSISGDVIDRLFLQLYLISVVKVTRANLIHCLVMAHGYSTASSIATVINKMLGKPILDYIDMPLNVDINQIGQEVTGYINRKTINTGLILMVDMGSLKNIHHFIHTNVDFPIGIISNVSTQMALFVGEKVIQQEEIQTIISDASKQVLPEGTFFYPEKTKKNLIITCCNTGIGTAKQIKQLLDNSIPDNLDVVVNAYEYASLRVPDQTMTLTKTFNVLTVVGTMDPKIPDVPFIPLEKLILGEDTERLAQALSPVADTNEVEKLADTILHNFTIDRVINLLTILDARTVMGNIDVAMNRYTGISGQPLNNRVRMALYVHVSCLIERLIRNEPITTYNWDQPDIDAEMLINLKKSFSVMEEAYSVKIPKSELGYIYDIVHGNA